MASILPTAIAVPSSPSSELARPARPPFAVPGDGVDSARARTRAPGPGLPTAGGRGADGGGGAAAAAGGADGGPGAAVLRTLDRIERARARLDAALAEARRGRSFTAAELLSLQADAHRFSETVDLLSRAAEHGVQGVKQAIHAQN
jgi:hypothetical protein